MRLVAISKTVLTSATNVVEITSIPQTYQDLFVVIVAKSNSSGQAIHRLHMYMNNATTEYYYYANNRFNDGTSTGAGGNNQAVSQSIMRIGADTMTGAQNDTGANPWSYHRLYLPSYRETDKMRTVQYRGSGGSINTGYQKVGWSFGTWANTSAITSLKFENESNVNNFIAGSRFEIYGIA